jgi:Fe-S cluster assembly ATP-binding protein
MNPDFLERSVNAGFSGGEKKRMKFSRWPYYEPTLSMLDETDSGLDIDALKIVSDGINQLHGEDDAVVLITHYQRLLNYIVPDYVHVMIGGKNRESPVKKNLALELEEKGLRLA